MKKIILVTVFFIFSNSFAQSGWVKHNLGITSQNEYTFYDVQSLNVNNCYIVGYKNNPVNSVFLKTTDNGSTWSISNFPNQYLFSVQFVNATTGIISTSSYFLRTSDGGTSWSNVPNPLGIWMSRIIFKDTSYVYAVSNNSIAYSYDGGRSWGNVLVVGEIGLNDIVFSSWNTGIAVGSNSYKSTNAGGTWSAFPRPFLGISSLGQNIVACGSYFSPIIQKSTNEGNTWDTLYVGTSSDTAYTSIKYLDGNNIVAAGFGGKIIKSANGGANWTQQQSNVATKLNRISFSNPLTVWIVGTNGVILKTTTGGVVTGFTQTYSEIPDKFSLSQNYPNPFNPSTIINYQLTINSSVTLKVYDNLGNEVETLVNEKQNAGSYSVDFKGTSLPSGIYFYKLVTESFSETKKMILLK